MRAAVALLGLALAPGATQAQLAERVRAVEDGTVRIAYETKPGVEICRQGVRIGDRHMQWHGNEYDAAGRDCRWDVAEIEIEVRRGLVTDVEIVRDPYDRSDDALDLGLTDAEEVARYLLSLPYGDATVGGAEDAIFPAMIADATDQWRPLLAIARDRALSRSLRKPALFWLGQEAADAATEGLAEVARDDDEEQEIRNSAIFALSQRPDDEAIPVLMEVAREGEQAETRRTAMFWLAQSDDERVVRFFEDILLGRIR